MNKYGLFFDYTSRNELLDIRDGNHAMIFKYSYDANGNVTTRAGLALNDSTTYPTIDGMNRALVCKQQGVGLTPEKRVRFGVRAYYRHWRAL